MDDEVLIEQGGRWYKRISPEEAFRIRFDVPLYYNKILGTSILRSDLISFYRSMDTARNKRAPVNRPESSYWTEANHYVEVEHGKTEYVCPTA